MANQQDESDLDRNVRSSGSGGIFQIHVKGHLNDKWSNWLEGLELELLENGEMILSGPIADLAASCMDWRDGKQVFRDRIYRWIC